MNDSRNKIPSKKSRPCIYDVKFLALLAASCIYDVSRLRVKHIFHRTNTFWYVYCYYISLTLVDLNLIPKDKRCTSDIGYVISRRIITNIIIYILEKYNAIKVF
jgi:hypothetical protein